LFLKTSQTATIDVFLFPTPTFTCNYWAKPVPYFSRYDWMASYYGL